MECLVIFNVNFADIFSRNIRSKCFVLQKIFSLNDHKENKCARAQNVNFASILYMCDEFEVFYVWVS
ncbi:hypothetical protein GQ55_4G230000 [Panicum hallii var. hallii]|uniref:Uncharacterized protein n=1 Tax=Panicum hallii var. hallii TaxID=1504633 RepID=A0A2T7DZJ7_9POAL|nr:hypothetical protein GQ55_4G230000 [Panicum hallii var. hallii]